jgi:hypothetical protein
VQRAGVRTPTRRGTGTQRGRRRRRRMMMMMMTMMTMMTMRRRSPRTQQRMEVQKKTRLKGVGSMAKLSS